MRGNVTWVRVSAGLLGTLSWATVPVTLGVVAAGHDGDPEVSVNLIAIVLGVLFLSMLGQLVLTAITCAPRRAPSLALAAGVALWAGGSAVLNSQGPQSAVTFPAPGEGLFLAAYVGFAAYLVLDGGAAGLSRTTGLDAAITCGGAACLASFAVVTPVATGFGVRGLALLIALAYPLLDAGLVVLVIGQMALGSRRFSARTAQSLLALALLAGADTSFVADLSSGRPDDSPLLDLAYALAFLLLVDAARRGSPRPSADPPASDTAPGSALTTLTDTVSDEAFEPSTAGEARRDWGAVVLQSAAAVALVTLTLQPAPAVRPYVITPAIVTLVAGVLRLTLALRQARDAAEARRLSQTDDLTGLPNRRALDAWLTETLQEGTPVGLLLLDLDGLKEINDTLGHAAGDTVLRMVTGRLPRVLDPGMRLARHGSDEFAVLLNDDRVERLLEIAQRIRVVATEPVAIDGMELRLGASVGAAPGSAEVRTGGDLLRRADVAMYQARTDPSRVLLYDRSRDDFSRDRLQIAEELRSGIDRGELAVWYQPQVHAGSERPCSVEALVRWSHPTRGVLQPGDFLPTARRAGLMGPLTDAVLTQVVRDCEYWRGQGLDLKISVNVAPAELLAQATIERLLTLVETAALPEGNLVVEVTEDSFLTEPERAREVIQRLREHGLETSIDDYGTGYSSLAYLRDLPVQELKIDRAFIAQMLGDPRTEMIVTTTAQLAHGLGMRTVAEGVEDAPTAAALGRIGVDVLQGYYFSRPLPLAEATAWLVQRLTPERSGV